jgi:antimicrobial peptide system SdpB family protein
MPPDSAEWRRLVAKSGLSLVRLQVAGIYLHAAAGKFAIEEWADGTALYYWLLHPTLGAPNWLAPLLHSLLLNGSFVSVLTWSIVVLEFFLAAGLLAPKSTRKWLLAAGISLHLGIIVIHGLVSFGTTMVAALILFLRPTEVTFRFSRVRSMIRRLRSGHSVAHPSQPHATPEAIA